MSIVFNGRAFAKEKELELSEKIKESGKHLKVKVFTFIEDEGSVLYTRLKSEAAARVGISYEVVNLSVNDDVNDIARQIFTASSDPEIIGVMVQKPSAKIFGDSFPREWWDKLVSSISPQKDIDCLTPGNLSRIKAGDSIVIPATVRAVLSILAQAKESLQITDEKWKQKKIAVIGRSEIVGKPLFWLLEKKHENISLFGRDNIPKDLKEFEIIVSATGSPNLISADLLGKGCILIDVGAPKGDIDFDSSVSESSFITPVPGGVGPVTVISLMQNILDFYNRIV